MLCTKKVRQIFVHVCYRIAAQAETQKSKINQRFQESEITFIGSPGVALVTTFIMHGDFSAKLQQIAQLQEIAMLILS